jgi:hypothetical protein
MSRRFDACAYVQHNRAGAWLIILVGCRAEIVTKRTAGFSVCGSVPDIPRVASATLLAELKAPRRLTPALLLHEVAATCH